jgi:hypothetical protein
VRKIESRFVLHGLLVGIVANILFIPTILPAIWRGELDSNAWLRIFLSFAIKMLGAAVGAYVGGLRRKKLLSAQVAKSPS